MSLVKISRDDIENFTIVANPKREFTSSSLGTTGSVNLFARHSSIEKEVKIAPISQSYFNDQSLFSLNKDVAENAKSSTNIEGSLTNYLSFVNGRAESLRKNKRLYITRFEPSSSYGITTLKKDTIRENLYDYYRIQYPEMHWGYTNYHSLNFFTASSVPTGSVYLYPNSASVAHSSLISGSYVPHNAWTFEFYINPRYTTDQTSGIFHAGTVMHLSSTFAVNLLSGTSKDSQGFVDKFRISLQLSHSADIVPSAANAGGFPNNLIFLSPDNSLYRNHWHHVAIRWGTSQINLGSGSIFIDGEEVSTFVIPSATIAPARYTAPRLNPDVLCIGNYYQGHNTGTAAQSLFFSNLIATQDGLKNLVPTSNVWGPDRFTFSNPLNAEVHDLRIYNTFRTTEEINKDLLNGPETLDNLLFYLPPFFTKESPTRTVVNSHGGVLKTPFIGGNGTTIDPFNIDLSFGVGGRYLNLENFLRDFPTGFYPRQLDLTGSQITINTQNRLVNSTLYLSSSVRKRNVSLLPCDNGLFIPNFNLLKSGVFEMVPSSGSLLSKYVNDLGNLDLSIISLNNMVLTSSIFEGLILESGSIYNDIASANPDNPNGTPNALGIFQRTRDDSSNEISMFDISNIYFGNRINPGSLTIIDSNISGTDGRISISVKDNQYGGLYRSDCLTPHAFWNNIGNVFYNEGIAVIKSPNIPFFGKDQFFMDFKGEHTIHVFKVMANAPAGMINSSSHPNYVLLSSSLNANESDNEFVYITNIDWMDENLNVIMKTNLAQPIKKRNSDKFNIVSKIDF